ncbi:phosphoribosyltransferase domain-containing protein [Thiobaca trueperi]|uniref:Phosphoribosyltransferase-like predicted ribonucleoside biosynthesis protein n=1 Tax=Thiobaca trueperi TaxID=127458 RepID=A0A4R3MZ49_9GAMM|nr:phosphoribosyltransferase domain-containing protein [Thiobaca trueperi]TCT19589.1 phosphoribosyltransferase-like predicted ribonucleoside biosynthesis protein [Thiobaca trueperi]
MSESRRVELVTGTLSVQVRESAFPLDDLCGFAARDNRKRGFLFLSKVLGKHWPALPSRMRQIHQHLAAQLELGGGPWLVLAMAETATGLGQGVFEALLDQRPGTEALFIHSTRYRLAGRPFLAFEEPHCHAPDQFLYEPLQADHLQRFETARDLILVDDEISTGTTLCNLVDAYRARNPQLERVHFVAITNFSGADCAERFAARLGLPVQCVAALAGDFSFQPADLPERPQAPAAVGDNRRRPDQLAEYLGRFGIDRRLWIPPADIARLSAGLAPGAAILVLGTGEFMHVAFRVGLELEAQGFAVAVQSTTRSPILLGADIGHRLLFADNYGEGIRNYLYNVDYKDYARIVVCHETPRDGLDDLLQQLGPDCLTYGLTTDHS